MDATSDPAGVYLYIRDLEDGRCWSAGFQPTAARPDEYEFEFSAAHAVYRRVDGAIHSRLEVGILPDLDVELRRVTLFNQGDRRRTLELTTYLEWVLQSAAADAAHPAFSKLFVETAIDANRRLILARRRRRDAKEPTLWGAHWIVGSSGGRQAEHDSFETSRMEFIGRGRSLRQPAALDRRQALSGTSGPVLDAIASVRRALYLERNESAVITYALAVRDNQADVVALADRVTPALVDRTLSRRIAADVSAHIASRDGDARHRFDPRHIPTGDVAATFAPIVEPSMRRDRPECETLQFDNGIGGFTAEGDEYVIRLRPDDAGHMQLPPMPWSHVVANRNAGFVATETGAGFTWTVNSRENRLTPWSNDPVCDPHSEVVYLRDARRGAFWSLTPGPVGANVEHEVRYGFGFAQYEHTSADLRQRMVQFVPRDDAVKVIRVSLENGHDDARTLDLFFYAELALGGAAPGESQQTRTWFDRAAGIAFAINASRELSTRIAFAACIAPTATAPNEFAGDRWEFVGRFRNLSSPAAVASEGNLSGRGGSGCDACAALRATLQVGGGASAECWILIGEAEDEDAARAIVRCYSTGESIDRALADVRQAWRDTLGAVQVETPSPSINIMVNGWLPYQNLCCRMWGRSAYYQSGGAYGFRDQLQDAGAYVYHRPDLTREQIVRHAAAQFVEGDVLHWWHPPSGRGTRTRISDDLLWLPLAAADYVETTGDAALWDEQAPFLAGPPLAPDEAERFFQPAAADVSGSIYEHACRAIDRSLAVGKHGLPLIGSGDWNDGLSRVGAAGRGESIWMAFFLDYVIQRMSGVCAARGDEARRLRYAEHQSRLRRSIEQHGWDGQWFRRAYFDDGSPLGAADDDECQIDALVQAWAVLSGAADSQRARQAMSAVERRLVRDDIGLIQLLDPPFDRMSRDPGYIKGYVPGVRENGGQYTHGVLWFVRALAHLGRGQRAVELLEMLNPIHHARTPADVAVYQVEPYVVAADVYSQPPHAGRGGWTWYTGSAGWMFRVAVESILGLHVRDGRELVLNPCISGVWPRCRIRYRLPSGGEYEIAIENPDGRETGVRSAEVDGQPARVDGGVACIPLLADGQLRRIVLQL